MFGLLIPLAYISSALCVCSNPAHNSVSGTRVKLPETGYLPALWRAGGEYAKIVASKGNSYSINVSAGKGVPKENVAKAVLVKGHGIKDDAYASTPVRQVSLLDMESVRGEIAVGDTIELY